MNQRAFWAAAMSAAGLAAAAGQARAQSFGEGFEAPALPATWTVHNQSSPAGTSTWGAVTSAPVGGFPARTGARMAAVPYTCGSGLATISNWLIAPQATLQNGDTFVFWTRTTSGTFPDRMQVRVSLAGASVNTGTGATDVGDFTTLALDINPTYSHSDYPAGYPFSYHQFIINVSGLAGPTPGRFAFRYFVEGGGPSGGNSDCVAVDDVAYSSIADPTGACCMGNGSCAQFAAGICTGQGGTYQGDGTACATVTCPAGACCLPSMTCSIASPSACAAQSGTYRGDGSACATANCPFGACCLPSFTCAQATPAGCAAQGGTYRGDGSACATANCPGPSVGPDIVTGAVYDVHYDGANGAISAYSVGTDACNVGDFPANWYASTPQHPVIAQNLYRLKDGRFEQLGQSWLKHAFAATNSNSCGTCVYPGSGSQLGRMCSDIYSSGLNGSQGGMGPRSLVNVTTGTFPYPFSAPGYSLVIDRRVQVFTADVTPAQNAGALYFAEAQYVSADDAQYGNGLNNASYRRVVSSTMLNSSPGFADATHLGQPAIRAWKDQDPAVSLVAADYTEQGLTARFWVAGKATDNGNGTWHYEYAVYNINSDRSAGSFSVPLPAGAGASNPGFHAPWSHSGEPYDNSAWGSSVAGTVTFATMPYSSNPNANAVRWGTLYNFRFDANAAPGSGSVTLGLFKPGTPDSLSVAGLPVPAGCYANCDGSSAAPAVNVADFTCFLQKFAAGDPYANCDQSTTPPTVNVADFTCFLQRFAGGCL